MIPRKGSSEMVTATIGRVFGRILCNAQAKLSCLQNYIKRPDLTEMLVWSFFC